VTTYLESELIPSDVVAGRRSFARAGMQRLLSLVPGVGVTLMAFCPRSSSEQG
jgi:hypothetical protein